MIDVNTHIWVSMRGSIGRIIKIVELWCENNPTLPEQSVWLSPHHTLLDQGGEKGGRPGTWAPDAIGRVPDREGLHKFDVSFQPSLDLAVTTDLASLRFLHRAENIVFLGPPSMGNTHLALTLGFEAVRKGFQMQYANASTLIERLVKANRENKLEQRIEALTKFRFLIINERAICHLPVMGLDPLNYPNPIPGIVK